MCVCACARAGVGRCDLFLCMVKDSNEQIPRYNAVKYVIKLFAERKSLLYRMESEFADPLFFRFILVDCGWPGSPPPVTCVCVCAHGTFSPLSSI